MTPSFALKRRVRYRYYVSRAVTEGQSDLAGLMARVPAIDVEKAVLDALHKLASTVDSKRWLGLLGPRPHVADKLIEFPATAPRDSAATADASGTTSTPSMLTEHAWVRDNLAPLHCIPVSRVVCAISSGDCFVSRNGVGVESRRLIEAVVERIVIRDGSIEIALTRDAAAIVGETTVITAWRKPPAHVSRELIPTSRQSSETHGNSVRHQVKLLAGIAKARAWLDELIAGAGSRHRQYCAPGEALRPIHHNAALAGLSRPSLVQAIADNRLPRSIGLTRLADLPSDSYQQFKMLGLQAPREALI